MRVFAGRNRPLDQTNASIVKNDVRMVWEVDAISAKTNSTTKDVSNRAQKWNVGPEHRKERETFRGCFGKRTPFLRLRAQLKTGCEPEFNFKDV